MGGFDKLVIAEKPSVAQSIEKVIGADKREDGYLEGKAPQSYSLTALQRDANRYLGFTAQQTLDYTQSLYEKKLVTYPRTDSRFLTEDMAGMIPNLAQKMAHKFGFTKNVPVHPMRGIEDMVEQNDNNFDGVINNVKVEPSVGTLEIVPEDKKSVLEKLKEQSRQTTPQLPVPERKPIPGCCFEREIGEC